MGSRLSKYSIIILLFLLVIVGCFLYLRFYKKPIKETIVPALTTAERKDNLLFGDPFLLPDATEQGTTKVALPEDLKFLLINASSTVNVVSANYPDNKKGYHVEILGTAYPLSSILGFYVKFNNKDGWKIQKAAYIDGVGYANLENSKYFVQIIAEEPGEKSGNRDFSISMKIIQK